MVSSSNLIPIYFPQMANDGVITQDELNEEGVVFSVVEYQGAEVGDYISLSFDVTMSFYLYIENEPVSQYFPWTESVPAELVPDGSYQSWYTVVDIASNSSASPITTVFVDRDQQGTLPAPTFPEAATNNNTINDVLAFSDGGTTVQVPVYSDMAVDDRVVVYWSGFNQKGGLVPGSATTVAHTVTADDLNNGFTVNITSPYITVIGTGTAMSWYTVHSATSLPERSNDSTPVNVDTSGQLLPAPFFPEGGDGWIDAQEAADGTPLSISAYRNISVGDVVTTYWQGYSNAGLLIPAAYNQQSHVIVSADLTNGFSVNLPESVLLPISVGYGQSYYTVTFATVGVGTGTSLKAQVNVDTAHVLSLPAPVFPEAQHDTISTADAVSGGGTPMVISYTDSLTGMGMTIGDTVTLQWTGYHYGDANPVPGTFYSLIHTVTINDLQTGNITALIPTEYIIAIGTGYAVGRYQVAYQAGGIGNSATSNVLISSDVILALTAQPTEIEDDGISASVLSAQVKDASGSVVADALVSWTAATGSFNPVVSRTDQSGIATSQFTSTVIGDVTVVASLDNQSSQSVVITVEEATSYQISDLQTSTASIQANDADAAILTASVIDNFGTVATNVTVYWTVSTGTGTLTPTASVTNSLGIATTQLTTTWVGNITVVGTLSNQSSRSVQVTGEQVQPPLQIMGARSSVHASCQSQVGRLSVFNAEDLTSISAYWYYEGESPSYASHTFIDTKPYLPLNVTSSDSLSSPMILNPSNVTGNGNWDDNGTGTGSFCALLDNETVVGWGDADYGGSTPPSAYNQAVYSLSATFEAFGSIRSPNSAYGWGANDEGGSVPSSVLTRTDIIEIKGTQGTFACRGTAFSPYIQVWGWATDGQANFNLNVPSNIANRSDIVSLHAGDNAFAVVTSSGTVYAWGDSTAGGSIPGKISELSGITDCCSSRRAFAVIYDGRLQAWGDSDYGSDASSVSRTTTAQRLVATESAFTALLSTGGIVCWGYEEYGGDLPSQYKNRIDVVDIKATYGAFAALCTDGSVFCWGNTCFGGDCGSVASQLVDVVALSANGASFAALKRDGTVVTWGNAEYGGSTSGATGALANVQAIYGNTHAFIALTADETVVAWGEYSSGVAALPELLQGNLSYLKK